MFAVVTFHDGKTQTFEVSAETFEAMNEDFRTGDKSEVYDVANGGVARVDWKRAQRLDRHDEDPNALYISVLGSEEGRIFTDKSMENW